MSYLPPRAGDLRDRISVERRGTTSDGMGGIVPSWEPVGALTGLSARIEAMRGGETVKAMRLAGENPADITIRWSTAAATITNADRVRDDRTGATFAVKWTGNLDNERKFLVLACQAGGVSDD